MVAMLRLVADPGGGRRPRCGCSPGRAGGSARRDIAALWRRAGRPRRRRPARDRSSADERRRAGRARRRRRLPGRRHLRSRARRPLLAGGSPADRRAGPRADRTARAPGTIRCPSWSPRCAGCSVSTPKCGPRSRSSAGWSGTEHLDAFADVVADFAARGPARTVDGLLAYLDAADGRRERPGARRGRRSRKDRVQILTVHAAKGLEWQVVAVPHLSGRVFPSTASTRTWLTDAADLPPLLRGDRATRVRARCAGARHVGRQRSKGVVGQDRRAQAQSRSAPHRRGAPAAVRGDHPRRGHAAAVGSPLGRHRVQAARTVGLPRASSRTSSTGRPPRGRRAGSSSTGRPTPADGEPNPLRDKVVEAHVAGRSGGCAPRRRRRGCRTGAPRRWRPVHEAAESTTSTAGPPTSTRCSPNGTAAAPHQPVDAAAAAVGQRAGGARPRPRGRGRAGCDVGCRPGPTRMRCWARRFTTGCSGSSGAERLFDLDDLPGAVDGELARADAEELAELQAAFVVSPWAARTPIDVEVPFDMVIGEHGGARPHRRGVRRRRRRVHRRGLEDRRTAGHARRPAAQRRFSSPSTGWRGRRCTACPSPRCARRSTTCAAGAPSRPTALPGADELAALLERRVGLARGVAVDLERRVIIGICSGSRAIAPMRASASPCPTTGGPC